METKTLDVTKAELGKAVDGLQKLLKVSNAKSDILQEREKIHLQVSMKKIPNLPEQTIKVNLPHGLFTADTDVCLFVKDLDKKSREFEVSEEHFSDMLLEKGVNCVRKVIPLKALKLEYKPFEAKRNLSNEFDLFLADSRIIRLLPSLLGKNFYGRKRNPIQVDLEAKDLKEEISKAVNNTRCILKNRGSSCLVTVGYSDMTRDQIVENVLKTVEQLSQKFPGGPNNIRSLHIKTTSSTAIPFFVSLDSGDTVVFPERKKEKNKPIIGEITTVMNKKVRVTMDGKVKLVKGGEGDKPKENRKRKNPKANDKENKLEESTVGVEAVEVKIEYDSQGEVDEEPAQKKVKKTPKKDSAMTPKAVERKTPKKSPKVVEAQKNATPVSKTPNVTEIVKTVEKENQKSGKKKQDVNSTTKVKTPKTPKGKTPKTPKGKTPKGKTPKGQSAKKDLVSDILVKQEDSNVEELDVQTPVSVMKSKAKTPKSAALTKTPKSAIKENAQGKTPKSAVKAKGYGKTPKSATMEKAAKKLKEITPPTVKRLQSKARVLTPDTPSGKKKKN